MQPDVKVTYAPLRKYWFVRVLCQDRAKLFFDLVCTFENDVTVESINAAMKEAAEGPLKGVLSYATDPIVSCDIIDDPHSSIFASDFTAVVDGGANMVKVLSWYDNEWGYSVRTADLIAKIGSM